MKKIVAIFISMLTFLSVAGINVMAQDTIREVEKNISIGKTITDSKPNYGNINSLTNTDEPEGVFDYERNLAYKKAVSGTEAVGDYGGALAKLTDGNKNSIWNFYSNTIKGNAVVDLGSSIDISKIVVYGRSSQPNSERINFAVQGSNSSDFLEFDSFYTVDYNGIGSELSIPVATGKSYRYIRVIQTDIPCTLVLTEIEVCKTFRGLNVAKNKNVTGNQNESYGSLKGLTDNSLDSYWYFYGKGYAIVDLENYYNIYEINLLKPDTNRNFMNLAVEVSNDPNFIDCVKVYEKDWNATTDTKINIKLNEDYNCYRYVRIRQTAGPCEVFINEIEVIGNYKEVAPLNISSAIFKDEKGGNIETIGNSSKVGIFAVMENKISSNMSVSILAVSYDDDNTIRAVKKIDKIIAKDDNEIITTQDFMLDTADIGKNGFVKIMFMRDDCVTPLIKYLTIPQTIVK